MTGTLHKTLYIYDNILLNSPNNEKCCGLSFTEHQNTYFMFNMFFSENRAFLR
jgi:hypothetical protein